MERFFGFVEKTLWGAAGLAIGLIVLFAVLHLLRTNQYTGPTPVGTAAGWVGTHAQNY